MWKCEFVNLWICEFGVFSHAGARAVSVFWKNIFYFIKYKYNTLLTHYQNWASPPRPEKTAQKLTIQHFNNSAQKIKNSCFHKFTNSQIHKFTCPSRLITLKNKGIFLYYSQLDLYDKLWFITGHPLILLLLHRYPQERRHKSTSIVILSDFLSLSACVASSLDKNKLMYLSLA